MKKTIIIALAVGVSLYTTWLAKWAWYRANLDGLFGLAPTFGQFFAVAFLVSWIHWPEVKDRTDAELVAAVVGRLVGMSFGAGLLWVVL